MPLSLDNAPLEQQSQGNEVPNLRTQIESRNKSIADGIGAEYAAKYVQGVAAVGSSVARIKMLASVNDAGVNRWIVVAKRAIGAGDLADAKAFIEEAEREAASPLAMAT